MSRAVPCGPYEAALAECEHHRAAWRKFEERREHMRERVREVESELAAPDLDPDAHNVLEAEQAQLTALLAELNIASADRPDVALTAARDRAVRARDAAVMEYVRGALAPVRKIRGALEDAQAVLEATLPAGGQMPDVLQLIELAGATPNPANFAAAVAAAKRAAPELFLPIP